MNESLWLAADPSMSLTDLTCELIQMGVPDTEALPWQEKMLRADVSTVAQLLKLTMSQFEGASSATLSPFSTKTLGVCLGSVGTPHVFAPDAPSVVPTFPASIVPILPLLPTPPIGAMPLLPLQGGSESMVKIEAPKGGTLSAVAEMLEDRRPFMYPDSYFPPNAFDKYHHSIPKRGCDKSLRKLIVQEIEEVVGDLLSR